MGEDASIDEFIDAVDERNGTDGDDETDRFGGDGSEENDETEGNDGETGDNGLDGGDEAVAPTVTTYEWTPAKATCDVCGATIERRWRDGDGLVCSDCKEW